MKILDLPFRERPIQELLAFDEDRRAVDRQYAGYGWARVPLIWICDTPEGNEYPVEDALVLALHSADLGEALPDDIELEFELPGAESVTVLASQFLEQWLPTLPQASAIVLSLCNPHHAVLPYPRGARVPVYIASDNVEAWLDHDKDGRIELVTDWSWARLTPPT